MSTKIKNFQDALRHISATLAISIEDAKDLYENCWYDYSRCPHWSDANFIDFDFMTGDFH